MTTFGDVAYDCAMRTRVSFATRRITFAQAVARGKRLAKFLPKTQDQDVWLESWVGIATGIE
jgi:hypothetical protein